MGLADLHALQKRLAALADCLAKGADSWDRLRISGGVLDIFRWGLVPEIPALREIWEAARKVHYAAMVDIFGADSAKVSAALHYTFISPFASPVMLPPVMPLPQPPPSPQPATMPQPAAAMTHSAASPVLAPVFRDSSLPP